MIDIKTAQEKCIEELTQIEGIKLEASANLCNSSQIAMMQEGYIYKKLRSKYVPDKVEYYLRLTLSYQGRLRDDLVRIGTAGNKDAGGNGGNLEPFDGGH